MSWPVASRRIFIGTLPVSAPTWVIVMAGLFLGEAAASMLEPVATFWNAPPVPLRHPDGRYVYRSKGGRPRAPGDQFDARGRREARDVSRHPAHP